MPRRERREMRRIICNFVRERRLAVVYVCCVYYAFKRELQSTHLAYEYNAERGIPDTGTSKSQDKKQLDCFLFFFFLCSSAASHGWHQCTHAVPRRTFHRLFFVVFFFYSFLVCFSSFVFVLLLFQCWLHLRCTYRSFLLLFCSLQNLGIFCKCNDEGPRIESTQPRTE